MYASDVFWNIPYCSQLNDRSVSHLLSPTVKILRTDLGASWKARARAFFLSDLKFNTKTVLIFHAAVWTQLPFFYVLITRIHGEFHIILNFLEASMAYPSDGSPKPLGFGSSGRWALWQSSGKSKGGGRTRPNGDSLGPYEERSDVRTTYANAACSEKRKIDLIGGKRVFWKQFIFPSPSSSRQFVFQFFFVIWHVSCESGCSFKWCDTYV